MRTAGDAMDSVPSNSLQLVRNQIPGRKLLNNERNKRVCHRGRAFYYTDEDDIYHCAKGLLPTLAIIYWPDFDINEVTRKQKTYVSKKGGGRRKGIKNTKKIFPVSQKEKKRGRFYGVIRGDEVHNEIQDFIDLDRNAFTKKHPEIHDFTKRILLFISDRKWLPFLTEFPVFDEDIRMATSIDLVCLDIVTGKVIFLEFKTGYAGYFDKYNAYMRKSLSKLTNSPSNQAHIQLITSVLITMKSHRISVDEFEMYVIRVDDMCLSPHKVSNDYLSNKAKKIYSDLHEYRNSVTTSPAFKQPQQKKGKYK